MSSSTLGVSSSSSIFNNTQEVEYIKVLANYIKKIKLDKRDLLEEKKHFYVNVESLLEDSDLKSSWPDLSDIFEEKCEFICGLLGLSMHHIMSSSHDTTDGDNSQIYPIVQARLETSNHLIMLKDLKSHYYQRFVSIQGTVVKVSTMTVHNTWLTWQCGACLSEQVIHQPEARLKIPTRCSKGCRNQKNFIPLRSSKTTICVDRQMIRIQEIDDQDGGRVPRTVDCELLEDLCDTVMPGDIVKVNGIVKVTSGDEGVKHNKKQSQYFLYIKALGVSNTRNQSSSRMTGTEGIQFTYNDYALIQDIHSFGNGILKLLINSLCPAIFGQVLVKTGLLLGLFGGTIKASNTALPVRGDPHILVVGDPGLGKSQMLTAACNVAPRGVFVTGNTTTSSGLTVTLTRESGNDFSLEAGALVLADQGCCCIDEFDKMSGQHSALLEAMEQQCISVAKAGVVCTMPARTAVLAAANPVGGHYNKGKTVAENLKLGPALLSRFDLVFILIDKPDEMQDGLLSEHVMSLHSKDFAPPSKSKSMSCTPRFNNRLAPTTPSQVAGSSLSDRLVLAPGENVDPVPPQCLKKYIAYARRYVQPKLLPAAAKVLQTFFLELRAQHQTADSTPITTRQLESMIRLTEARAKLELRDEC